MKKNGILTVITVFLIWSFFYGYHIYCLNNYGYFTVGFTRGEAGGTYGKFSVKLSYNDRNNEICFGRASLGRGGKLRNFKFENACYLICVYGDEIHLFIEYPLDCSISQEEIDRLVDKNNIKVPYSNIFRL